MVSVSYIKHRHPKEKEHRPLMTKLKEFDELPGNLTILPGVRQLRDGLKYLIGQYPSGKQVMVPYKPVGAPPADMLPIPQEPVKPFRFLPTYDDDEGVKRPVVYRPRRLHVVEWQKGPLLQPEPNWTRGEHSGVQAIVDLEFRPLMRSPDCGKTWQIVSQGAVTTFVQYHIDQEVK